MFVLEGKDNKGSTEEGSPDEATGGLGNLSSVLVGGSGAGSDGDGLCGGAEGDDGGR